ncbi:MAG: polymer-forming cytoskeletal protein [Phycisphaerales bacterium]|nr:polymer-forming cytoskeletal protein [Phycisphaerales bacterium]
MSNPPPSPAASRTVRCYHCREVFDVPPKAMSISCPWCYKRVTLDDIVVKDTCMQSRVQTCGRLLVHRKGSIVASIIEAMQGIEILGHAEGAITSGGPVLIGPKARVKGDVTAPSIWMEPGAVIESGYFKIIGPDRLAKGPSRPPEPPAPIVCTANDRPPVVVPAWKPVLRR